MDNKIKRATGLLIIEVVNSNPNGDPDRESDPRQRPNGLGEISPVSFKRKIRDLVEDAKGIVFTAIAEKLKLNKEDFKILESRGRNRKTIMDEMGNMKNLKEEDFLNSTFVRKYWDARIFGNTFLQGEMDKGTIKTGVVQFVLGLSVGYCQVFCVKFS